MLQRSSYSPSLLKKALQIHLACFRSGVGAETDKVVKNPGVLGGICYSQVLCMKLCAAQASQCVLGTFCLRDISSGKPDRKTHFPGECLFMVVGRGRDRPRV